MPLDTGWVTKLLHNLWFFFFTYFHRLINACEKITTSHEKWKICSITRTHAILDRFDSKAGIMSTVNKAVAS